MTAHSSEHEHAAELLPWLVNGTLAGAERERVERHVRHCLACRAELAEQTRLAALVRRQPVVPLAADANFERLKSRLDKASREGRPRRTLWAVAAAAAVAVVAVGLAISAGLGPRSDRDAGAYRTLSDAAGPAPLIDVIFADGVREAEMRALLDELGAEIVAGPSRNLGRYTLRLPASADTDQVMRRLSADARVRFAGPTFAPPPEAAPAIREGDR